MSVPVRAPNPFEEADCIDDAIEVRAAEALAKFQTKWPPERCQRLGRMLEGDYSQVWEEALAPKDDTPADETVRGLLTDDELLAHSKNQRRFVRERVA